MTLLASMWTLAGLGWEPEIRGVLTVAVAVAVLCGSVWLLLATNSGYRLGSLLALAGFFGWLFIMGLVWWIYGIGYVGSTPSWEARELNRGDLSQAVVGPAADLAGSQTTPAPELVDLYCPGLVDSFDEVLAERTRTGDFTIPLETEGLPDFCDVQVAELLVTNSVLIETTQRERNELLAADDPRRLTEAELEADIAERIADDERRRAALTLSGLATVAPDLIEEAKDDGLLEFGGWNLLSAADAGEAQAVADVALRADFFPEGNYVLLDAFQQGGKPQRGGDSHWHAVVHTVRTTLQFWNPTNYAVIQVQRAVDKPAVPGEPPPFPEADPDAPVVSVVLVRDLGNLRVPPALTTIGSLLVLIVLSWMLHVRDKHLAERTTAKG